MAKKRTPRIRRIVESIIESHDDWKRVTKETARHDAELILEALCAELGESRVLRALKRHGIDAVAYDYLVVPLCTEARLRRIRRTGSA